MPMCSHVTAYEHSTEKTARPPANGRLCLGLAELLVHGGRHHGAPRGAQPSHRRHDPALIASSFQIFRTCTGLGPPRDITKLPGSLQLIRTSREKRLACRVFGEVSDQWTSKLVKLLGRRGLSLEHEENEGRPERPGE